MRAFRFRLQRLLGLAAAERQESARRLGEEQASLRRREDDVRAAAAERLRSEEGLRSACGSPLRLADWLDGADDLEAGRRVERLAAGRLAEQRGRVAERQAEYLGARREERLLEALRDRQQLRWRVEHGRREQAAVDDLAQVAREFRLRGSRPVKGGDEGGQGDSRHTH